MRYKDLSNKEMIDVKSGLRMGVLGHTDMEINTETGQIEAFVTYHYNFLGLKKGDSKHRIPWKDIKKIGQDVIVIEDK
ncbi:YlmC/YmxH family sporulation protein [Saliterribacillus persicus]|uniref:YlmC/YmxH family sporulation protein n=1 Tax=Saliterribacillus persicus TaxID=930114 RepID=A0A368XU37_9BACI|nr:YlmC/YmxH family sporulation protein [Saliterribacillus persicus]RCW70666.1 YlmC/YmxH family sporulation protein [Saliterribacillus persicus]